MSNELSLDDLKITSPCSESWDEMMGNDRVRFCSHCSKHVNDLTSIGKKEARKLIRRSNGNICVRYIADPVTKAPAFKLSKPVRISRAPAIAAGVVGTTLGLSSLAYAQGEIRTDRGRERDPAISESVEPRPEKEPQPLARFRGVVVDQAGAVVPGKDVLIRERTGRETHTARTNSDGTFLLDKLSAGDYMLRVPEGDGFGEASRDDVKILPGGEAFEIIELPIQEQEYVVMGGIGFASEVSIISPLSRAVENGDEQTAIGMLAAGEDPNIREMDGRTPIFFAVSNANVDLIRALLLHGADVNARDENGETPLMQMDYEATEELARILIDAGAKLNRTSKKGRTALMAAAQNAPAEVINLLIEAGAEINARDEEGWTALMHAAYADDLDAVRFLLFAGAEVNVRNEEGENAWDQTADPQIEDLLVSFGSEVRSEPEILEVDDLGDDTH